MNRTLPMVLVGLVFVLITSAVLGVEAKAKRKRGHHASRAHRASATREASHDRGAPVHADARSKRKGAGRRTHSTPVAPSGQLAAVDPEILTDPLGAVNRSASLRDLGDLKQTINPGVLDPATPDPCDEAEPVLNGFLPQTVTLTKSDSFWAKLTVGQGVSVITCDLANLEFGVRFDHATMKTYVRASAGGVSIGGWNQTASLSGSIRVSFAVSFSPPSTFVLTNLTVLGVNFANTPNWLDNSLVKEALNAIFPDSMVIA